MTTAIARTCDGRCGYNDHVFPIVQVTVRDREGAIVGHFSYCQQAIWDDRQGGRNVEVHS